MAASMRAARRMVAAAEKTGKLYMVSQSRRWETATHDRSARRCTGGEVGASRHVNCEFYLGAHFGAFRDRRCPAR